MQLGWIFLNSERVKFKNSKKTDNKNFKILPSLNFDNYAF